MRRFSRYRFQVRKQLKLMVLCLCIGLAALFTSQSQFTSPSYAEAGSEPLPIITRVEQPEGNYLYAEVVHTSIQIFNPSSMPMSVKLDWRLYSTTGQDAATQELSVLCLPMKTTVVDMPYQLTANLKPGHYYTACTLFALQGNQQQLSGIHHGSAGFWLFAEQFKGEAMHEWQMSDKMLGRTQLQPQNVSYSEGLLTLSIPKGTLNGAEIWTSERKSYGTYAVRMKLPNAPGAITGFFLYEPPDYAHEIDIELYNQKKSQLMMTTYANGSRQNAVTRELSFDPTDDYHEYLIDYQPVGLSFYVDGQWQQTWLEGYSHQPMRLMLNVWYPLWLEGTAPSRTEKLYLEWIRYN